MDFTYLNYFRTAARLGNLSQAARELYISQPGLSRYLTKLEDETGVPLFDRRKGKIELNTYGQIFLTNVNRAFDCLDSGLEEIQRLYARDQNILSIACSIEDYLTDCLNEFSPLHPEIGIRQFSFSVSEIEQQLIHENLDMAICAHPLNSPRLQFDVLSQCPYVLVCANTNPLAVKTSIHLRDAKEEQFICETPRLGRRQLMELCDNCGFEPVVNHEVESGYILHNLLEAGTGVALIPLAQYEKTTRLVPGHNLHAIALKDTLPMAQLGIASLPDHTHSSAARIFIDFLHTCAENERSELFDKI